MYSSRWSSLLLATLLVWFVGGCTGEDEARRGNNRSGVAGNCDGVSCSSHGTCAPNTGSCVCGAGYTGSDCNACASGFHRQGDECVPVACSSNQQCDDGRECNGRESCDNGSCGPGTPIACGDHASCQEPGGACSCDEGFHDGGSSCLPDTCTTVTECDDDVVCNGLESCTNGSCRDGTPVTCAENAACQEPAGTCECDGAFLLDGTSCVAGLEIVGSWIDAWGGFHDVSTDAWAMDGALFHISQLDNKADFLVAQNDGDNAWNSGLWSRFDWVFDGSDLYYCQIAFDAADEAAAAANTSANRSDLAAGCANFAWSKLVERLEVIGSYTDDWNTTHAVAQATWTSDASVFHISQFDNEADFLVARNDPDNAWNPDLWSRFDWTKDSGELYFCQIAYDAADEATAAAATAADHANLATGCAGFSWSKLNPLLP